MGMHAGASGIPPGENNRVVAATSADPKPFPWVKQADAILASIKRG